MRTWAFVIGAVWAMAPVKPWIASQYFQLPEERKQKYRERMAKMYEKYDDMEVKEMLSLFGF